MKKVYQTIFEHEKGNCYQAIIASLLNLELSEVPHFMEEGNWIENVQAFMKQYGYGQGNYHVNPKRIGATSNEDYHLPDELPLDMSVNGYFDAVVFSPSYFKEDIYRQTGAAACHAVICDKDYNIIHDPAPKYAGIVYPLSDELGKNGIVGVEYWKKTEL